MEEQEQIQVSFQLPASALDSLSRLVEQLRRLTETAAEKGLRRAAPEESGESGTFDPEKFLSLHRESGQAEPVRAGVSMQPGNPERAGQYVLERAETGAPETVPASGGGNIPEPERRREEEGAQAPGLETAYANLQGALPDAPAVRADTGGEPAGAEAAQARPEERDIPLPSARTGLMPDVQPPQGAGVAVTARPEPPANRWTGAAGELVTPGPAPLTAEAVSLAFQRDGRRYDNGFPLY